MERGQCINVDLGEGRERLDGIAHHREGNAGPHAGVLVNNAGFSWFGPTADLDVATFDQLFAANLDSRSGN